LRRTFAPRCAEIKQGYAQKIEGEKNKMMDNLPPLWEHQKQAVLRAQGTDCLGLFMDIGVGKTRAAIDILRYRFHAHNQILRTLIICPKIVCTNWEKEWDKYSKIHPWNVVVLRGSSKERIDLFTEKCFGEAGPVAQIVITNYEALLMKDLVDLFHRWGVQAMVADEAHRLKNPTSKRAKECIKLGDTALYRYALTGTPILNSAMDIFNVFRFLDRGATFGTNFWKFRSIWFEDQNAQWSHRQGHFPKYMPRPETYGEFSNLVSKKAVRAIKSECLDLPPLVRKEIYVDLSPEQKKAYESMKKDFVAYLDDLEKSGHPRAVIAQLAVTKALRLQQITTGYAKCDDGEIYTFNDIPRLEALEDLLEDLAPWHKIIVWSIFHENYKAIKTVCEKLHLPFVELHGEVASRKRDRNIELFNNDQRVRVLIANQAAAGIGVNLIPSDVAIFYSRNFSLEHDIQAEGRNYRGGSEIHNKITRIDIIATGTIDELISKALASKQTISEQILDWRKDLCQSKK
jgi:SNF2 family DNA or RNA helicase